MPTSDTDTNISNIGAQSELPPSSNTIPTNSSNSQARSRDSEGRFISNDLHEAGKSTQSQDKNQSSLSNAVPSLFSLNSKTESQTTPPLLDIKITNPITYLKIWWKRILANEGIDFRLRIHPLTAIIISLAIAAGSFGLGRVTLPANSPIIKYIPQLAPSPAPDPWRETAFTGILRYSDSSKKYYLTTGASEAITLEVPANVDLSKQSGKRIFATGKYNKDSGILKVASSTDLEILPARITTVPTIVVPADQSTQSQK